MNYQDSNIPIPCSECSEVIEGVEPMVKHILNVHNYSLEEAENFARLWADEAYEQLDLEDAWRAEEYRQKGYDPMRDEDEF